MGTRGKVWGNLAGKKISGSKSYNVFIQCSQMGISMVEFLGKYRILILADDSEMSVWVNTTERKQQQQQQIKSTKQKTKN